LSTLTGALIQLRRERGFPFVPYAGQRVRMDPCIPPSRSPPLRAIHMWRAIVLDVA
jgi:hypothetical protein